MTGSVHHHPLSSAACCAGMLMCEHVLFPLLMKPVDLNSGQSAADSSYTELSVQSPLGRHGGVWVPNVWSSILPSLLGSECGGVTELWLPFLARKQLLKLNICCLGASRLLPII